MDLVCTVDYLSVCGNRELNPTNTGVVIQDNNDMKCGVVVFVVSLHYFRYKPLPLVCLAQLCKKPDMALCCLMNSLGACPIVRQRCQASAQTFNKMVALRFQNA